MSRKEVVCFIENILSEFTTEQLNNWEEMRIDECCRLATISSLQLVELLIRLEDEYDIEIEVKPATFCHLIDYIVDKG